MNVWQMSDEKDLKDVCINIMAPKRMRIHNVQGSNFWEWDKVVLLHVFGIGVGGPLGTEGGFYDIKFDFSFDRMYPASVNISRTVELVFSWLYWTDLFA